MMQLFGYTCIYNNNKQRLPRNKHPSKKGIHSFLKVQHGSLLSNSPLDSLQTNASQKGLPEGRPNYLPREIDFEQSAKIL